MMKKILLTSTGFDNENIKNKFLALLDRDIKNVKVLFIITAAIDPEAIRVLPYCLDDLSKCGILDENIRIYDMHKSLSVKEISEYDAIYVCGGDTEHLVERINEINFKETVNEYIKQGGIYIGVSAGSVCASGEYQNGLDFIINKLDVHCEKGTANGLVTSSDNLYLTDNQAIYISDDKKMIFE